ncbi:hypothetical protein [Robiginitalea sp. IMCC43444]|uniref:hypothetical protein n=1 Tax=Robiginitalea sp. IMCC43444 TaxID=3459121 RepID=UPI0040435518
MKQHLLIGISILSILLGCSSVRLHKTYRNPDIVLFNANKLLVVGMTSEVCLRDAFETSLQLEFSKRGIETMKSIDLFDVDFTSSRRSREELARVEEQLLEKDFDAILFTKVVDAQTETMLRQNTDEQGTAIKSFSEDYLAHQGIYLDPESYEKTTKYLTETSLYCICVGKDIDLIWRSYYEINNPGSSDRVVRDYVKLVLEQMQAEELIIGAAQLSSQ